LRVVCRFLDTAAMVSSDNAFKSWDLPAFGEPTIEMSNQRLDGGILIVSQL